jgi:hypothetical protein
MLDSCFSGTVQRRAQADYASRPSGGDGRKDYFSRSAPLVSGVSKIAMIAIIA